MLLLNYSTKVISVTSTKAHHQYLIAKILLIYENATKKGKLFLLHKKTAQPKWAAL